MARAAVKAKQAQNASAQPAKPARRRAEARGHAGGGNPNQQLFFMRLRRKAKPVYVILAVLFAITFAFLGVGSGSKGGLDQLFQGLNIFHHGGNAVAKAQKEIGSTQGPEGLPRPCDRVRVEGRQRPARSARSSSTPA